MYLIFKHIFLFHIFDKKNSQIFFRKHACDCCPKNERLLSADNNTCNIPLESLIETRKFMPKTRKIFKGIGGILEGSRKVNNAYRIELLYRQKRDKTSRLTMLNIRKLYVRFVYFKLHVTLSEARQSSGKHLVRRLLYLKKQYHHQALSFIYSRMQNGYNVKIYSLEFGYLQEKMLKSYLDF